MFENYLKDQQAVRSIIGATEILRCKLLIGNVVICVDSTGNKFGYSENGHQSDDTQVRGVPLQEQRRERASSRNRVLHIPTIPHESGQADSGDPQSH